MGITASEARGAGYRDDEAGPDIDLSAQIGPLVAALAGHSIAMRRQARRALVTIGRQAVPALIVALGSLDHRVRWEAAKALGQIGDPEAAPALVRALEDEEFDVRWLAAKGLVRLGREGAKAVLEGLVDRPKSVRLRESAHHVLSALSMGDLERVLAPVITALEGVEPELAVLPAAKDALSALKGSPDQSSGL